VPARAAGADIVLQRYRALHPDDQALDPLLDHPDNDLWDSSPAAARLSNRTEKMSWRACAPPERKTMADKTATLKLPTASRSSSRCSPAASARRWSTSNALRQVGMFTYDPGFMSTASCTSAISYIDGAPASCCIAATDRAAGAALRFLEVCYLR